MTNKAYISGVGMVPFQKPGKSESYDGRHGHPFRLGGRGSGL